MRLGMREARIGVVLAMVMAVAATSVGFAAAGDSGGAEQPPTVVRVEMMPDCVNLSAEARQHAVTQGYCRAPAARGVAALGSVPNPCGSSWVLIWPKPGHTAIVGYEVKSTAGWIFARYLAVTWRSESGRDGSWPDRGSFMATDWYGNAVTVVSGRGAMTASLEGHVDLVWGLRCYVGGARDTRYVR
jgi:hypothetical protein